MRTVQVAFVPLNSMTGSTEIARVEAAWDGRTKAIVMRSIMLIIRFLKTITPFPRYLIRKKGAILDGLKFIRRELGDFHYQGLFSHPFNGRFRFIHGVVYGSPSKRGEYTNIRETGFPGGADPYRDSKVLRTVFSTQWMPHREPSPLSRRRPNVPLRFGEGSIGGKEG